ncbi:flagellar export protein FliJ [Alkaliphilus pronyensis]|uniref:Flagellar FliJ protein n=1 Tax=Alkaliphilus pronyensis TaxID=1482732 RepID=A0A6I0FAT3_9FIRM|nr:flagellar export protein FliJ [Alkaliphilus pronyensis]KAB3535883.1 flagellar export protein FliJ [Alkaliphilus pronyensis]
MKNKFSFRFESILNLKEKQEDNKKILLGTATKKLKKEEENLMSLKSKKNSIATEWKEKTKEAISIKEVQIQASKMNYIDDVIKQQNKIIISCEEDVTNHRVQLIEATKQSKIFNRLKEKDTDVYKYQLMKNEESLLDQLVSYRSATK